MEMLGAVITWGYIIRFNVTFFFFFFWEVWQLQLRCWFCFTVFVLFWSCSTLISIVFLFFSWLLYPLQCHGEDAGADLKHIWARQETPLDYSPAHRGPKGTSPALWTFTGTSPATSTPSIFCLSFVPSGAWTRNPSLPLWTELVASFQSRNKAIIMKLEMGHQSNARSKNLKLKNVTLSCQTQ